MVKAVVQREQQEHEGEDEPEPVRLAQHGGHAQEREGDAPGKADEEIPAGVFHPQQLPGFAHQSHQQHQQAGQDAEQLTECVVVTGLAAQAERELGEQGDEVGVVLGDGIEEEPEACACALGKGSFGVILL